MNRPDDEVERRVVEPLRRATTRLDDVRAARLATGIEGRLDAIVSAGPVSRRPRQRWILAGVAVLAVGAAAAAMMLTAGTDAPSSRMEAPASGRLHASLGAQGRLMLVGPGSVARTVADSGTELALDGGLLVVEYERNDGPPLRVRARGTIVTVTGTLFAVDARRPDVRVAVAHGIVEVSSQGGSRRIEGGWSWTAGDAQVVRIPGDLGADLAALDGRTPGPTREPQVAEATVDSSASADQAPTRTPLPTRTRARDRAGARDLPNAESVETPPAKAAAADDVETAYAAAEALMRAGDSEKARAALLEVVARANGDVRAESARVDLARLALAAGRPQEARRFLGGLADPTRDPSLTETVRRLRCRVEVVAGADAQAAACLQSFRRQHPASPHDAEVLAQQAAITASCDAARPLLEEYLRRYPRGPFAADAATQLRACGVGR